MKADALPPAAFEFRAEAPVPGLLRFSHEAMASVFEVLCVHEDAAYAAQAAQAAFALVDRLEQEQSRFIANSDVSRIGALAAGESTRIAPTTMECLMIARHLCELTAGAFDATLGSGWERLELVPEADAVRARETGARLDLGGIGKGYAVDRVAELLIEWEVSQALVHGGFSSVRALEAPPGADGWPLRLALPSSGRVLARLSARRRAFGASGLLRGEHIRDPSTGLPVEDREAAWVAVPAEAATQGDSPAAVADALSTACMVLAADEVDALRSRHPQVEVWLA